MLTVLTLALLLRIVTPDHQRVIDEGKLLYRLEAAGWRATDRMIVNQGARRDSVGGYVAFADGENLRVITYSRYDSSKVMSVFVMNREFDEGSMLVDNITRKAQPREQALIDLRIRALRDVAFDTTHFFKHYRNTHFNLIPIIDDTSRRVYVMTTIEQGVVMPIGNDYLLRYSPTLQLVERKKLHQSFIPIDLLHQDTLSNDPDLTWHKHADAGDPLPTATDICALLLYTKNAAWHKHGIITSQWYMLFDRTANTFDFLPRGDVEHK